MNIFTGFQRQFKIQQEKLTLQKIDNGFKSLKQGIDLQTKQASISFENAITSLNSQSENMELASNIARITKIKYEQGVGSNLEVVDAENSLRQAQTNYYSALFDAMVAKVDLDKAFGKLLPQQK
jgi:outer membrane protein TolC